MKQRQTRWAREARYFITYSLRILWKSPVRELPLRHPTVMGYSDAILDLAVTVGCDEDLVPSALYTAIMRHHFPSDLQYNVVLQTWQSPKGEPAEFLVVRHSGHVVLVVNMKTTVEEVDEGPEAAEQELVDGIRSYFFDNPYPSIYGIVGIGLAWLLINIPNSGRREYITSPDGWNGNVSTYDAYNTMVGNVVAPIDAMTKTVRPSSDMFN